MTERADLGDGESDAFVDALLPSKRIPISWSLNQMERTVAVIFNEDAEHSELVRPGIQARSPRPLVNN